MRTTRHKAIAAAVSAVLVVITNALTDSVIDVPEWGDIAATAVVSGLGVYAVWRTRNQPLAAGRRTPPAE